MCSISRTQYCSLCIHIPSATEPKRWSAKSKERCSTEYECTTRHLCFSYVPGRENASQRHSKQAHLCPCCLLLHSEHFVKRALASPWACSAVCSSPLQTRRKEAWIQNAILYSGQLLSLNPNLKCASILIAPVPTLHECNSPNEQLLSSSTPPLSAPPASALSRRAPVDLGRLDSSNSQKRSSEMHIRGFLRR